jgi:hypothetical protein
MVLMDVTKAVSTAVPKPEGTKAPINQFAHVRAFPDATFTDVVSPNADTVAKGADAKTPGSEQVAKMDAASFFSRLNTLMKDNPPAAADADTMKRFAAIGVEPGKPFDAAKLGPAVAKGVEKGGQSAREKIDAEAKKPFGKIVNNWSIMTDKVGRFGTDYVFRSAIARVGLGPTCPRMPPTP